jgi:hypothetical protein
MKDIVTLKSNPNNASLGIKANFFQELRTTNAAVVAIGETEKWKSINPAVSTFYEILCKASAAQICVPQH